MDDKLIVGQRHRDAAPPFAGAREKVELLLEALIEAASSQLAKDMASHIGDQIHAILKRQAMLMPTVSLASAAGALAARQILEEVILFARNSMEGDAADEAAIEQGLRELFDAVGPHQAFRAGEKRS